MGTSKHHIGINEGGNQVAVVEIDTRLKKIKMRIFVPLEFKNTWHFAKIVHFRRVKRLFTILIMPHQYHIRKNLFKMKSKISYYLMNPITVSLPKDIIDCVGVVKLSSIGVIWVVSIEKTTAGLWSLKNL